MNSFTVYILFNKFLFIWDREGTHEGPAEGLRNLK